MKTKLQRLWDDRFTLFYTGLLCLLLLAVSINSELINIVFELLCYLIYETPLSAVIMFVVFPIIVLCICNGVKNDQEED